VGSSTGAPEPVAEPGTITIAAATAAAAVPIQRRLWAGCEAGVTWAPCRCRMWSPLRHRREAAAGLRSCKCTSTEEHQPRRQPSLLQPPYHHPSSSCCFQQQQQQPRWLCCWATGPLRSSHSQLWQPAPPSALEHPRLCRLLGVERQRVTGWQLPGLQQSSFNSAGNSTRALPAAAACASACGRCAGRSWECASLRQQSWDSA